MSEAEKLPKNQPAEIHVDGIPQYAGEISATTGEGLLFSDARLMRGKQQGPDIEVHAGAKGDLVFRELFDDEGDQLVVPVSIVGAAGSDITLDFRDQASAIAGTVLKQLTSRPGEHLPTIGKDKLALLAELKNRSLRQLDKILEDYFKALSSQLYDRPLKPRSNDQQEQLHETITTIRQSRESMCEAFAAEIEGFYGDVIPSAEDASQNTDKIESSELNLVDIQDFEDTLTLNRMIQMGQDKHAFPLECLTL